APILERIRTVYANKALTRLHARTAVAHHFLEEFCLDDAQCDNALSVCLTPHLFVAVDIAENKKNDQFGGAVLEFDFPEDMLDAVIGSDRVPGVIPQTVHMPHSLPLEAVISVYVTPSARPMKSRIMQAFRNLNVPFRYSP
ncbi:MAG: hypothetical protein AABY01_03490, partial [Nanoarchaeota archaeon]